MVVELENTEEPTGQVSTHHPPEVTAFEARAEDSLPGWVAGGEAVTQTKEWRVSLGPALSPHQRHRIGLAVQFHICQWHKMAWVSSHKHSEGDNKSQQYLPACTSTATARPNSSSTPCPKEAIMTEHYCHYCWGWLLFLTGWNKSVNRFHLLGESQVLQPSTLITTSHNRAVVFIWMCTRISDCKQTPFS